MSECSFCGAEIPETGAKFYSYGKKCCYKCAIKNQDTAGSGIVIMLNEHTDLHTLVSALPRDYRIQQDYADIEADACAIMNISDKVLVSLEKAKSRMTKLELLLVKSKRLVDTDSWDDDVDNLIFDGFSIEE